MLSCSDDGINKEKYRYEFFKNSALSINEMDGSYMKYGMISNGEKVVFKYTYVAEDNEQIADDEYAEFIHFEIDSNLNSFEIDGEDFSVAKTILTKSCFCYFPDDEEKNVNPVGAISGEKISNDTWRVNFDVTFYADENRSFEANFILK
jgi:hypothetical protein